MVPTPLRILFDHGKPRPLRRMIEGHTVDSCYEKGWAELANSALLDAAEREGYDLLITTDQGIRHQQNLAARSLAIIVIRADWRDVRGRIDTILRTIDGASPGRLFELLE